MKLREKRYEPKYRKNRMLRLLTPLLCLGVLALWVFRVKMGLDVPTLMIYTGIALLLITLSTINRKNEKELKVEDSHLEKLRDNMGKDDYNDTSIFWD